MLSNKIVSVAATVLGLALTASAVANNTIYVISNGDTPSLSLPGFTPIGEQRVAECIPAVFAPLDVGLIVTCPFDKPSGLCAETIATATPVADSLGLNLTTSCGAGENANDDCISNLINKFGKTSTQSVLIVWDISDLDTLFENLNVDDSGLGSDAADITHYDLIYTVKKAQVTISSQECAGIDGQAPGTFRRSLASMERRQEKGLFSRIVGRIN